MKNLTESFLSEDERKQIIQSVQGVEKITSGEIVPMVVSSSYHYPLSNMTGGITVSFIIAIIITAVISIQRRWGGFTIFDLWIFPTIFGISFLICHEIIKRIPALKRLFISADEMKEEVEEAALTSFFKKGLNRTKDQTGILIFISVFERKAWILADKGINDKLDTSVWQEIVNMVITGIKEHRQSQAICNAVKRCGELLKDHFPIKPDDTDELANLIVED